MQCPNCHHITDDQHVKCAACGQVCSRPALERLSHLEFLLAWLDEHQADLAAPAYRRLRRATQQQLVRSRQDLKPPVVAPCPAAAPSAPFPSEEPLRPVEAVLHELALVTSIRVALAGWAAAGAIGPATAASLGRYLGRQREELKLEQAGRAGAIPPGSQLDEVEYALGALDEWGRAGAVTPGDRPGLAAYLHRRREALMAPKHAAASAAFVPRQTAPQPAS